MGNVAATSVIRCATCGAANRVRSNFGAEKMRVCGHCKSPLQAAASKPAIATDANFAELIERSPLPVLLDMWAAWCGPCRMIAPTVESLAKELSGRVLVAKLDVDANKQTAARFGVQSIPTLLILKQGREAGRIVGAQSREAILANLKPHMG